jgi:diguanylate cyclase (GGDEF)-like protein/PAS domain S-box-containing protein
MHILFVHSDLAAIERCLHVLHTVRFVVKPDMAQNAKELAKRVGSKRYDLIVAECPATGRQGMQTIELLRKTKRGIPLILVTETLERETALELAKEGIRDCIEMDCLARLPMAIRRVRDEKHLREERDRAEKELRLSKAQYHALVENSAYGMCLCSNDGTFLDVNQGLVTMLGYQSKEELKSANLASGLIQDPLQRAQLLERSLLTGRVDPVEAEWKRKDGTMLRVRLSGRQVRGGVSAVDGYGIIVEDVTGQRALEDQLRKRAATDGLTGLANYLHLVDVLDTETTRSKRTGREFTLLTLDLDELRQINDRYGRRTGNRALCRVANVLRLCCRSTDTAARYGGDEFALVLMETPAEPAALVARRICELLANDGEEPNLTVSIGMASYPKDAETVGPLLFAANTVLDSMKRQRARK